MKRTWGMLDFQYGKTIGTSINTMLRSGSFGIGIASILLFGMAMERVGE